MSIDVDRMKATCRLMDSTGSDSSQYVLIRLRELKELISAYERDQIIYKWLWSMINDRTEAGDDQECTEEPGCSERAEQEGACGDSDGSENGEVDYGEQSEESPEVVF